MTKKSELGKRGEEIACKYLEKKKYKIIERNFWKPWGELDIVARSRDRVLVFVEVKTMKGYYPEGLQPEDQMTQAKRKKFERAASTYAGNCEDLIDDEKGWRLDLVAVILIGETGHHIRHYENI